jgi:hypothetical protein
LCDPATMRPVLGIELDDASHQRPDRQTRDDLVDSVFEVAGLPLLGERARASYDVASLAERVSACAGSSMSSPPSPPAARGATVGPPSCAKCGVPMVLRTASRGDRKGERFWGCPNYPKCRETVPHSDGSVPR